MLVDHNIWAASRWYWVRRSASPLPFYCNPSLIGAFAVPPEELRAGEDAAIFRLLVTLSMYQALRDVVIMRRQRTAEEAEAAAVADLRVLGRSIAGHFCSAVSSAELFERTCDVTKKNQLVDCATHNGERCHVKEASIVFNRMGDMGKLPTSAWLRLFRDGGARKALARVCAESASPTERASLLVHQFAQVYRVGRKVATMFVSALSTPALAPGLTPFFPDVDGNELVVVDTNVARAIDVLRAPGATRTYDSREQWLRDQAARIDLREFQADLPSYSPRLVQEALYAFCSISNRVARGDSCARSNDRCAECVPRLCPFMS